MSRLKNDYDFVAGIHFNGQLHFNRYRLLIDFYTNSDSIEDQNIAVERLFFFIHEFVSRSIFVHEDDLETIKKYTRANIPVLTLPSPGPFDPVVLAALVTKMNMIMEDTLVITDAELSSSLSGFLTYIWDSADEEDEIHLVVNEEDECKWWASADPRFYSYEEGTDIEEYEEENTLSMTWEDVELGWYDEEADDNRHNIDFVFDPKAGLTQNEDEDDTVIRISDFTNPKK